MRLKKVFELLFIFLLPLIILVFNFDFKKQNEYDASNNLIGSKNYIEFESPFSDYKDNINIYKNYLNYNQLKPSSTGRASLNNGIYTYTNFSLPIDTVATVFAFDLIVNHKYFIYFEKLTDYVSYVNIYNGSSYITNFSDNIKLFYQASTTNYNLNSRIDADMVYNGTFYFFIIDLTEMYGIGYEPSVYQDIQDYILFNEDTIISQEIEVITDSVISTDWQYNYTIWGRFFNFLNKDLHITGNFILRFSVSYCMLAIINIFIWNLVFYTLTLLFKIILFKRE